MSKDYYEILGVSKTSSADEIKKAYRKLAHQHHPDKGAGGDEQKFKEINEAYQVLGNPDKRRQYDQFGSTFNQGAGAGGAGFSGASWEDIFQQAQRQGFGGYNTQNVEFDLGDLFGDFFGFGTRTRRRPRGRDLQTAFRITFRESVFGVTKELNLGSISNTKEIVSVKIPAGINDGETIRLTGKGERGPEGATPGDLYITLHVTPDPKFRRVDDDIVTELPLTFSQAALGDKIEIETLDGMVKLKVPSGTQPGKVFRLRGKGVPHLRTSGRGDHLIQARVEVPTRLSRKQKRLLEEFDLEG